jgi:hypothetical protein
MCHANVPIPDVLHNWAIQNCQLNRALQIGHTNVVIQMCQYQKCHMTEDVGNILMDPQNARVGYNQGFVVVIN